jgi:hypothetical protein
MNVAATGRSEGLRGTLLSGALYEWKGLAACLWVSTGFVIVAGVLSRLLPEVRDRRPDRAGQGISSNSAARRSSTAAVSRS